jgi:hypothetical protein
MRNIFNQYSQPENRLTHALACTLEHDRDLLRPFLMWLKLGPVPPKQTLRITEQQVPGVMVTPDDGEGAGLPDLCVFNDDGWAALFESKVQAKVAAGQLHRHLKTAARYGYEAAHLVVISVDGVADRLPRGARHVVWRDLFVWFRKRADRSFWARQFVDYMQDFEKRMLADDYGIRGTITMFDGLRFDAENPYTYREGKRLIRLLGDELQNRKDLRDIGIDPKGNRRPAITGRAGSRVWDFLPLEAARGSQNFTAHPHLTLGIGDDHADASITVPNGVQGGFRTKLRDLGEGGFRELLAEVNQNLARVLRQAPKAKPVAYAMQRHYPSQRSHGIIDGRISADLRTAVRNGGGGVKHQPEWVIAIYSLLTNKRSNIQFGISVQFPYDIPKIRTPKAVDLFAESWIAASPLLDFVLE